MLALTALTSRARIRAGVPETVQVPLCSKSSHSLTGAIFIFSKKNFELSFDVLPGADRDIISLNIDQISHRQETGLMARRGGTSWQGGYWQLAVASLLAGSVQFAGGSTHR
jgi:hypothetical protein